MTASGDHSSPNQAIIGLLKKIKFLSGVEEVILQKLALNVRKRTFKANTALFHTGDPGHFLYMVVAGWVRIEKVSPGGQTLVIGKRGPGSQLGEMALLDGSPRMADAVTDCECEIIMLERTAFLQCLMESPSAALAVMASLADMLRSAGAALESFRSNDARGRLAELLLGHCESHGIDIQSKEVRIDWRVTHQSLADQVGVTRETISRALLSMEEAGVLTRSGHRIVSIRPDKLRKLAEA